VIANSIYSKTVRSKNRVLRGNMTKPVRKPTEPLRTRHIFLDTEVYRRAGFNLFNSPFTLLAREVDAGRIVLHVSDITLAEIQRQLREIVLEHAAQAKRLARDFNRIAQISGHANTTVNEVSGSDLADACLDRLSQRDTEAVPSPLDCGAQH
jgi:PIN domain